MKIENARIESATLGYEGHGLLTIGLTMDYGGGGCQTFGGYNLSTGKYLSEWVKGILDLVGVDDWKKVEGKFIRVEIIDGRISRIGHILKDEWFDPKEIK